MHMWSRPWAADGSEPSAARGGYAAERACAERALATALVRWSARFPGVPVDREIVSDLDLAPTIERASRRGRLLVAGIGRHGRFAELLYGSAGPGPVGLRSAPCPVVLVPEDWPAGGLASGHATTAAGPR
ncbi:hypothetical protein Ate02nite_60780 [Paractinoplanes tereljensis]|uniref:UspA domain-containing protein n=1 Tax=Paractinoplanes tereljensis TaxID=571912 RepID=A0A919NRH5_9ACTN|nr:hypothetical protein Ate02nite_60780 [Actinoplanes tereljensis]